VVVRTYNVNIYAYLLGKNTDVYLKIQFSDYLATYWFQTDL